MIGLCSILQAFERSARVLVQLIVAERALPPAERLIAPVAEDPTAAGAPASAVGMASAGLKAGVAKDAAVLFAHGKMLVRVRAAAGCGCG
jgi:hypothetical protein